MFFSSLTVSCSANGFFYDDFVSFHLGDLHGLVLFQVAAFGDHVQPHAVKLGESNGVQHRDGFARLAQQRVGFLVVYGGRDLVQDQRGAGQLAVGGGLDGCGDARELAAIAGVLQSIGFACSRR